MTAKNAGVQTGCCELASAGDRAPGFHQPERRLYCHVPYGAAKAGTVVLVTQDAESATVSMTYSEGTRLALDPFLSTPYREWRDTIRLVRRTAAGRSIGLARRPAERAGHRP